MPQSSAQSQRPVDHGTGPRACIPIIGGGSDDGMYGPPSGGGWYCAPAGGGAITGGAVG